MTPPGDDIKHWTDISSQWIEWASRPAHDAFWAYQETLTDYIGPGSGRALEIGCGEGRVSRLLKSLGYRVTATDPVPDMVAAAAKAGSADEYAVAEAANLPFETAAFELVMAYNVLMDVEDLGAAVAEARRLLAPGGLFFISLVHPFSDRGRFAGTETDAPFVVDGTYFGVEPFQVEVLENGLPMTFAGWSRPLSDYMAALEGAGLAVTSMQEPRPNLKIRDSLARWTRIPMFLWLKARIIES